MALTKRFITKAEQDRCTAAVLSTHEYKAEVIGMKYSEFKLKYLQLITEFLMDPTEDSRHILLQLKDMEKENHDWAMTVEGLLLNVKNIKEEISQ